MRYSAVLLFAALAGCSSQPAPQNETASGSNEAVPALPPSVPANGAAQDGATADPSIITPEGWGPLRIGMAKADVVAAVGAPERPGAPDFPNCEEYHPPKAPAGMWVMIENDVLTRIGLGDESNIATAKGIHVGDTAKAVRDAYGGAVTASPHKYVEAPAEYLTGWTSGGERQGFVEDADARGIRFEIGKDGRVQFIYAGGPSIQYVESCA